MAVARRASTPALILLLTLLTWRTVDFRPVDSLDPSWQAALHMAAQRRLPFEGLVFTYGPLGFLAQPVGYFSSTVLLSGTYVVAVGAALCASLVSVLRRSVGLLLAALATLLLVRTAWDLRVSEEVVVIVAVTAFGLLRGNHSARVERFLVVAGGMVAGTHLLVKFNTGVTVFVVGAVTAWFIGRPAWRSEALFLGTAVASILTGWWVTGNGVADLIPFLDRSLDVASGYSEAMGIEARGRSGSYALAALVASVVLALGWWGSRSWPRNRRAGLALAGAMWLFAAFKLGFVRHDAHDLAFFGEVLLVGVAVAGSAKASFAGIGKALPAVGAAVFLLVYALAGDLDLASIADPSAELARAGSDLAVLASAQRRDSAVEAGRANLRRRYYDLDQSILAGLQGRTVHVRPWEAGIAWAYPEIRWRPLPVFQEYTAYTADLDRLNAAFLEGPRAPERILAEQQSIDIRNPDWESPAAVVAVICHYRELTAQARWQVLGRVADRCGTEFTLDVVKVRVGETVAVPDTKGRNVLLVARIEGFDHSVLYRLRSTLWRAPEVHVTLDGGRRHRLVPGTASNGLIVATPAAGLGFSQPFAPESATSLRVTQDSGIGATSDLSIRFVAIPILS